MPRTITFPAYPVATVDGDGQPVYPATNDPAYAAHAGFNMLSNALLLSGMRPADPANPAAWGEAAALMAEMRGLNAGGEPGGYGGANRLDPAGGSLTVTDAQLAILRAAWLAWLPSATYAAAVEVAWVNAALGLT